MRLLEFPSAPSVACLSLSLDGESMLWGFRERRTGGEDPIVQFHLAENLRSLGLIDEALAQYQKTVEVAESTGKGTEFLEKAKEQIKALSSDGN